MGGPPGAADSTSSWLTPTRRRWTIPNSEACSITISTTRQTTGQPALTGGTSLSVSNVWALPFGQGQRFGANVNRLMDLVAGGWEFNGITTAYLRCAVHAQCWQCAIVECRISTPCDRTKSAIHTSRIPNRTQWFNPAAYTAPQGLYRDGNVGRNSLVGPRDIPHEPVAG